jgi:hypothetical protein
MLTSFEARPFQDTDGPGKTIEVFNLHCYDPVQAKECIAHWPGRSWAFAGYTDWVSARRATFPTAQLAQEALQERAFSFVWL